jgi:protein TonB
MNMAAALFAIMLMSVQTPPNAGSPPSQPPRLRSGRITNDDYPRSALDAGAEGISIMQLSVAADGRVSGCSITESSGNPALDGTACSLAQRRFRFNPATDAEGNPTPGVSLHFVSWRVPKETPHPEGTEPASE